ncbi:hypothetical protein P872_23490 [Rhodonellum psychrophilum GCM71 = DSM 17998]|uniref:DUF4432 domain-containing protein n=2 Tax=Rhodonellum TaxID=336827 RepID=U5C6T9_9BACT|nr:MULTISPECIES: aldose 1-epimerase family protein [Rhodonellum]ERM84676.1 hypothetical protein P872_23490 [Rhodonellum psychrophilum GCM71 = DSM 17998]SDZ13399.1 protein of unknown function [Rhodonellum ikkaensis]
MDINFSKDFISNSAQLGGIETSILDNGPGKGVRMAWVNTGSGLRYKVVIDRGMDIAEAFFNAHSLAWISHAGTTAPQPFSDQGANWLRTFGGGLMTTCGLSHVGGPESDEFGNRGLHGNISNTPAEIISIQQPDPIRGNLEMSITGIIKETRVLGPNLELRRTISGTLGQPSLVIRDEITNLGNTEAAHMLLYHLNFGWPFIDEGTEMVWEGNWKSRDGDPDNRIFNPKNDFKKCPAPMDAHAGSGEDAAFIDLSSLKDEMCVCGFVNQKLGIGFSIKFNRKELPWLVNWQHWGKGEYVTALEPATNPPIGQAAARKANALIKIPPGEKRCYSLEMSVLTTAEEIEALLRINNREREKQL